MHRYEELEKLYYKKKRNQIITAILLALLFVIVYKAIEYANTQNKNQPQKVVENNITKENKTTTTQTKIVKNSTNTYDNNTSEHNVSIHKEKKVAKLEFILPNITEIKTPAEHKKIVKYSSKPTPKPITKTDNINQETVQQNTMPKLNLKVEKVDIHQLISSFNQSPNYDLAITISKEYLKRGNLKEAQKWALKANTMEPDRVESWLQFADILLKEGKKEKAVQILRVYIDSYGENDEIESKLRSLNE
ncbi:hypothetical protein [Caminibacter pacificus]